MATVDDAPAVADLVHRAYRSDESRTGWTTEADLVGGQRVDAAMVSELVTSPTGVVLVAEDDDGLLACCHLERRDAVAYLGMFAVRPRHQGRGTGRAMLSAAEEHAARAWGAATLEISVINHRHELIAWYERCGFARTGVEHAFPYGDERYGLPQRDDLVLLEMVKRLGPAA
ncbi:GNAT family N-acetyltransferase [Cellulomonas sp. APG4]|nr:GNAT family N-acetyltransferase [Cellulomonas sp. APG4]NCT91868.1 GNAT family N-acetyltransferase [Cellulomonas sp. APG4]